MSTDSVKKTIGVTLGVCIVCSILVSTAAVFLKPRQDNNKALDKRKNILKAGELLKPGIDIDKVYAENITPAVIELKTGKELTEADIPELLKPENYNIKKIEKDTTYSRETPTIFKGDDQKEIKLPAVGVKRVPTHAQVYFVKGADGNVSKIIFPVHGKGLWSTMYGFLALDKDLTTVSCITFYEHGETPGLGGEIDNAKWQGSFVGKAAFDASGNFQLKILKGKAAPDTQTDIDGLSGATLTTNGVDFTLKYWFGPEGYGPYIAKKRQETAK